MPITKARPVPTGQQEREKTNADVLRRRLMRTPTVEHYYKEFSSGMIISKNVSDRANIHKVGQEVEVNGTRYKIKFIERSTQGNVIHRIYTLEDK